MGLLVGRLGKLGRGKLIVSQKGFTIVELLIVIVVIAILAAITIVAYNGVMSQARAASVRSDVAQVVRQLEIERTNSGSDRYPVSLPTKISSSGTNTITYGYNPTSNRYCITVANEMTVYYASTASPQPKEGSCTDVDGLIGWWPLNNNADDASGFGDGSTVIGASPAAGQNGSANGAYLFNGVMNESIRTSMPNLANMLFATPGTSWTASVWFKYTAAPNNTVLMGRGAGTGGSATYALYVDGSNNLRGVLRGTTTTMRTGINDQWHLATVTWDGSTAQAYLDTGTPVSLAVGTVGLQSDYIFTIGSTNNGAGSSTALSFSGSLDDVRLYNRALSADEVRALYQAGAQ